jgi:hypothetical protein
MSFLIAGYVRGERSRKRMGSLVLAQRGDDGELGYAGNVGAGFSEREIDRLLELLAGTRAGCMPKPASASPRRQPSFSRFHKSSGPEGHGLSRSSGELELRGPPELLRLRYLRLRLAGWTEPSSRATWRR